MGLFSTVSKPADVAVAQPTPGDPTTKSIPEILRRSEPLGITDREIAALTDRPVAKVKGELARLQFEERAHFTGKNGTEKRWHPGKAPEPEAKTEEAAPRWLLTHASELAAENPSLLPPNATDKDRIQLAKRLTALRTPKGEVFVARPSADGLSRVYTPYALSQLDIAFKSDIGLPWSVYNPTVNGKPKKLPQALAELSTVAPKGRSYDSTIKTTHLDAEGEIREAVWQRLKIEAAFDSEFDGFLRCLGDTQYERLCDWFVQVVAIDMPIPILVLYGRNSTGKDLIALTASGLFTKSGTCGKGSLAINDFNTSIVDSPIALCSEGFPVIRGELISSNMIKDAVTNGTHVINGKHAWPVNLRGKLRWVVLSNPKDYYPTREIMDQNAIDALCRRIIEIETTPEMAAYLAALGGMPYTEPRWVTGERRAVKHVQWIIETHKIPPERSDTRFGIKEHAPALRRYLQSNSPTAQTIITGVVGLLNGDPDRLALWDALAVVVGAGVVLANPAAVARHWPLLGSGNAGLMKAPPQEHFIASELKRLSDGERATSGLTYVALRVPLLLDHARDMGMDVEAMQVRINMAADAFAAWRRSIPKPIYRRY